MEKKLFSIETEENMDVQERYFRMLDKILDAVALLRYEKDRENHPYFSVNQIHDRVLTCFSNITKFDKTIKLRKFMQRIALATGKTSEKEYYFQMLDSLYQLYCCHCSSLPREETTSFYNEILNKQQDYFCQKEKERLIRNLKNTLPLTKKKQEQVAKTARIACMHQLFLEGKPYLLGIDSSEILKIKQRVHEKIQNTKYLKKEDFHISEEQFLNLDDLFFTGELNDQMMSNVLGGTVSSSFLKCIRNQYYREILPYLENIDVKGFKFSRKNVQYDYNQLLIFSFDRYQENLEKLLCDMKEKKMDLHILEKEENQIFLSLLPLINILEDFDTKQMSAILRNADMIRKRLQDENISYTQDHVLNQLHQVMRFAMIYDQATPNVTFSLGEDVVEKILNGDRYISRNPLDYVLVYQQMLQRTWTHIPAVSFPYKDYIVESGAMSDTMRLLLSQNCWNSCLAPEGAGADAYYQSLTSENADALLIKDQDGNFVARSLLFRKGNYLVISAILGEQGVQRQFYQSSFLDTLSCEIQKQAELCGDSIDYLFLTKSYSPPLLEDYPLIEDKRITRYLPHADWADQNYLIYRKQNDFRLCEDITGCCYSQKRETVICKTEDFWDDICKIRALQSLSLDQEVEFDFYQEDFSQIVEVYKGQDWYLAIRNDGRKECVTLLTGDDRQGMEIDAARSLLAMRKPEEKYVKVKK